MSDPVRTLLGRVKERSDNARYVGSDGQYVPTQYIIKVLGDSAKDVPQLMRALEAVLEVCEGWESRGEHDMDYSKQVPEGISDVLYENGAEMIEKARIIRNAITEHLGGET